MNLVVPDLIDMSGPVVYLASSFSYASSAGNQQRRTIYYDVVYQVITSDSIEISYYDASKNNISIIAFKDGSGGASAADFNFKLNKNRVWVYNNPLVNTNYFSLSFVLVSNTYDNPYAVNGSFRDQGIEVSVSGVQYDTFYPDRASERKAKSKRTAPRQQQSQDVFVGYVDPSTQTQVAYSTSWVRPCRLNGKRTPYLYSRTDSIIFGITPVGSFVGVAYPAAQNSTDRLYRTIVIPGVFLVWSDVEKVFDLNACDTDILWNAALSLVPDHTAYDEVLVERYIVEDLPVDQLEQDVDAMVLSLWDNAADVLGLAGVYYVPLVL